MKRTTKWLICIALALTAALSLIAVPASAAAKTPFTDVEAGIYYEDAVRWAMDNGVTTGTTATTFSPSAACTRGQVVTFLWRAQGQPAPTNSTNRFRDVSTESYCHDAVLWAVELGITKGTSDTAFSPQATCTRAQALTFLWRAEGEPAANGTSFLAASYDGSDYQNAVAWADTCGMLSGMDEAFDATANCPRSDIVTYLYRFSAADGTPQPAVTRLDTAVPSGFRYSDVPAYSGRPFVQMNGNTPYFSVRYLTTTSYEAYSSFDSLGRCGTAVACVGPDLMPTEPRGEIGMVKPSGWHTVKYDCVDGKYLYNRCHLLGYQLTGENANTQNLITGTRYLNVEGMLPFEDLIAEYVEDTGNHVLYRVTPVFAGNNLLASGVLMEGMSCEDQGASVKFCVFCYNVQPGVTIDYATGDSYEDGTFCGEDPSEGTTAGDGSDGTVPDRDVTGTHYVLNTNTHKFHDPSCSAVEKISAKNRREYTGTREALIAAGYDPCKICNP